MFSASAVADLRDALRQQSNSFDASLFSCDDANGLIDLFSDVERLGASLAARASVRAAEGSVWRRQGYKSEADWLAHRRQLSASSARQQLASARQLDDDGAASSAYRNGDLSSEQAAAIATGVAADPSREAELVDDARRGDFAKLQERAKAAREAQRSAFNDSRSRRYFSLRKNEYGFTFSGQLPAPEGALLQSTYAPFKDASFKSHKAHSLRNERPNWSHIEADAFAAMIRTVGFGPAVSKDQTASSASGASVLPDANHPENTKDGRGITSGQLTLSAEEQNFDTALRVDQSESPGVSASADSPESEDLTSGASTQAIGASDAPVKLQSLDDATPEIEASVDADSKPSRSLKPTSLLQINLNAQISESGEITYDDKVEVGGCWLPLDVGLALANDPYLRVIMRHGKSTAISDDVKDIPTKSKRVVLARCRGICENPKCLSRGAEFDHQQDRRRGGGHEPENLRFLCWHCHALKTYYGFRLLGPSDDQYWIGPDDPVPKRYEQWVAEFEARCTAPAAVFKPSTKTPKEKWQAKEAKRKPGTKKPGQKRTG